MQHIGHRWVGPGGESCAVLVHSSDRAEARPFWKPILLAVDQHLPPLCHTFFSYDSADEDAQLAVRGTHHPISLLRRGSLPAAASHTGLAGHDQPGWSGAILSDLEKLSDHRWVFHIMDDAAIPDPIHDASLRAVLDTAQAQNASTVSLYGRSFGFWDLKGANPVHATKPAAGEGVRLDFFRATPHSKLVIQQNFALWRRDALIQTLHRVGSNVSPRTWEEQLERLSPARRETAWPDIHKALVVAEAAGYKDALLGVEDVANGGRIKDGMSRCAWIRLADRLGLARDSVPGGDDPGLTWPGASYDFCTLKGAIGDGAHVLKASPCACRMAKVQEGRTVVVKGVICGCNISSTQQQQHVARWTT